MIDFSAETAKQTTLLCQTLSTQLDQNNRYILLGKNIKWDSLREFVSTFYKVDIGRKSISLRTMIGLTIVKFVENLSDAKTLQAYLENPYIQSFCGNVEFSTAYPCTESMLSVFRKRIGEEGCQAILDASIKLLNALVEGEDIIVDTTAQIKNITYPTDVKLLTKVALKCAKMAKKYNIKLKNTYKKQIEELLDIIRFEKSKEKRGDIKKAKKRLFTIAGILVRELKRKLTEEQLKEIIEEIEIFEQIIKQSTPKDSFYLSIRAEYEELCNAMDEIEEILEKIEDCFSEKEKEKIESYKKDYENAKGRGKRNQIEACLKSIRKIIMSKIKMLEKKLNDATNQELLKIVLKIKDRIDTKKDTRIYSIHEPQVGCISKGKAGVKHEYGSKASIAITKNTGVIVGAVNFARNPHDSNTVHDTKINVTENLGYTPENWFADRGYRGADLKNKDIKVHIPSSNINSSESEKEEARKNFGRRSSIEPIIGHLKMDFRLARTFLKGALGDKINLILSCAAYNFAKWINMQKLKI